MVTSANVNELQAIVREVLKDVPIDYSRITLNVLPFDTFNQMYGDQMGKDPADKARLTGLAQNYSEVGLAFALGTGTYHNIYLREGLAEQELSVLGRELGAAYYAQANEAGKIKATPAEAHEVAVTLFEGYFSRLLQERYGWDSMSNISYKVNTSPVVMALNDNGILGRYTRRTWAIAANAGYDGSKYAASADFLRWYQDLITMPDPTGYMAVLDTKAEALDKKRLALNLQWRGLVDKDLSPFPDSLQRLLDPAGKYQGNLTRDFFLIVQTKFVYP